MGYIPTGEFEQEPDKLAALRKMFGPLDQAQAAPIQYSPQPMMAAQFPTSPEMAIPAAKQPRQAQPAQMTPTNPAIASASMDDPYGNSVGGSTMPAAQGKMGFGDTMKKVGKKAAQNFLGV